MTEATQVACFSEDRQRDDWPDPGELPESSIIGVFGQHLMGLTFNLVALLNKLADVGYR